MRCGEPLIGLATSATGLLAACSANRSVRIYDLASERLRHHITGHNNKVHAVQFSWDGRAVVSGSTDRTIRIWDCSSGREVRTLRCSSTCNALDLSLDGVTVVSGHQVGHSSSMTIAFPLFISISVSVPLGCFPSVVSRQSRCSAFCVSLSDLDVSSR